MKIVNSSYMSGIYPITVWLIFVSMFIFISGCKKENEEEPMETSFTDHRDGNTYSIVKIGDQVWMAENLRYLPEVHSQTEFVSLSQQSKPAYGVGSGSGYLEYNGSDTAAAKEFSTYMEFGVLYNWYAVEQANICPEGWHVATDDDWIKLADYLGGEEVAGAKLKSLSKKHWYFHAHDKTSTNESGFNGSGGGYRSLIGEFQNFKRYGYWWTASEYNTSSAWLREIHNGNPDPLYRKYNSKRNGFSVRCVRD